MIVDGLNGIEGFSCLKPKGSFYVFVNVTEACKSMGFKGSKELQEYLLNEAGVAVLPRTSFGVKNVGEDQEYIRLSYATSRKNISGGLERIKGAVEKR
jgi:aspartate/methionine/tyrosine aminotransferase